MLFGTGADDLASGAGAYRCSYAAAASTLIAGIAGTINAEWVASGPGSAADSMLNPQPASSDYRTEPGLDQNRAFIGLGYQAAPDLRVELGYMNHYVYRYTDAHQVNHVFATNVNVRFGFTPPAPAPAPAPEAAPASAQEAAPEQVQEGALEIAPEPVRDAEPAPVQ